MTHQWQHLRYGIHIEREVEYLRCIRCKQLGFRYLGRPVIYTWRTT